MSADRLINILVTITLVEMMAAIGLGVKLFDISGVVRNLRLLMRAAIANYVCTPIVTVGLLLWFGSPPMIAAGFLIVAVCPGAAYGPPFTAMANGNVAASTGLMVFLAGSSAICAPLLLQLLLPVMTRSQSLNVDLLKIIQTLIVTQLSPLFAGLCIRERRPALADKLKHPADRISAALNLCIFGVIVIAHVRTLAVIRAQAFMGMCALLTTSIAAGWLLGEAGTANRKAMSFSTSVRNIAVSFGYRHRQLSRFARSDRDISLWPVSDDHASLARLGLGPDALN